MMKNGLFRRLTAVCSAAALSAAVFSGVPVDNSASAEELTRYEFEDGTNNGSDFYNDNEGWTDTAADDTTFDITAPSGNGFVFLGQKGTSVSVTVKVETAGLYQLNICYCEPFDANKKVQYLNINGENQGEVTFAFNHGWEEISTLVQLPEGKSEIEFAAYWGYTFLDYLTLEPADESITNLSPTGELSNPNADANTRKLYDYLCSVYGNHIISGQQEMCGSHNYNYNADPTSGFIKDNEAEFEYIKEKTGELPAIRGIDFLTYRASSDYEDQAAERTIEWVNEWGGIATLTWHWNVPHSDGETYAFYVESASATYTDFSITEAVKEGTPEHDVIMADLALVASKLQMLEDAGVSVLWRPLHEAEGGWFWWGAEGPEACVALYRLMYDQFTNVYGLNNLIWVWTGYTTPESSKWYPGDDVVDIIGYDKYNVADGKENPSAIASTFYSLVASTNGQKMVTMSENDSIPSLENLLNDRAAWLYFCPWYGYFLTGEVNNPVDKLVEIYQSDYCITLDELPNLKADGTEEEETTTTSPQNKTLYGDVNCDSAISVSDLVLLARFVSQDQNVSLSEDGLKNADCLTDDQITADDVGLLSRYLSGLADSSEFG